MNRTLLKGARGMLFNAGQDRVFWVEAMPLSYYYLVNHSPITAIDCKMLIENIIQLCKNRVILFNNNTKDRIQRDRQLNQLLSLVDSVLASNGGKPFSDQIFAQVKEGALRRRQMEKVVEAKKDYTEKELSALKEEIYKSYDDQLNRITEMVEQKLNTTIERLEKQLAEEQAARLQAEAFAKESRQKSDEEIRKLKEDLKRAQEEYEEIRKRTGNMCAIL